jgi:hypothetical protein
MPTAEDVFLGSQQPFHFWQLCRNELRFDITYQIVVEDPMFEGRTGGQTVMVIANAEKVLEITKPKTRTAFNKHKNAKPL